MKNNKNEEGNNQRKKPNDRLKDNEKILVFRLRKEF